MNVEMYMRRVHQAAPECDGQLLVKAFEFAARAHQDRYRYEGEREVVHPLQVSILLAEQGLDCETIIAGLLHETISEGRVSKVEVYEEFGADITDMIITAEQVEAYLNFAKLEEQGELLQGMIMSLSKDMRVVFLKLADKLHELKSLKYEPGILRQEKARAVLTIYAPLAHRLGMYAMKCDLEDLALLYLQPETYTRLDQWSAGRHDEREAFLIQVMATVGRALNEVGIEHELSGREKNLFSIYRKWQDRVKSLDEIHDIIALRIITESLQDCYGAIGIVHSLWKPLAGRFKDYIAMPKENLYQSLHTTVVTDQGKTFEIQVRTREMHRYAEFGMAAHWRYKKQIKEKGSVSGLDKAQVASLQHQLAGEEAFVFSEEGDLVSLPPGGTLIDFAYSLDEDMATKLSSAKVNGRITPLTESLSTGDKVALEYSKQAKPNLDWLQVVKTPKAKGGIRTYYKNLYGEDYLQKGKKDLKKILGKHDHKVMQEAMADKYGYELDNFLIAIGFGEITKVSLKESLDQLTTVALLNQESRSPEQGVTVAVEGIESEHVHLAKCCLPSFGDDIVGYITRGQGVTVHRKDCGNIKRLLEEESRFLKARWIDLKDQVTACHVELICQDRQGLVGKMMQQILKYDVDIKEMSAVVKEDLVTITLRFTTATPGHVQRVLGTIKKMDELVSYQEKDIAKL